MLEEQIISFFGDFGVWVVVFVCACMPVIETRIAIPLGCATAVWGSGAMSVWGSTLVAFIGSTLVGILIVLIFPLVMKMLRKNKKMNNLSVKIESFFEQKFKTQNKKSSFKTLLFLTIFIALPVPLLGMYSGAGLCVFLKLKRWQSILALTVGNLINCILLALVCVIFYEFIPMLLTIMIIMLVLVAFWQMINFVYTKVQKKKLKSLQ